MRKRDNSIVENVDFTRLSEILRKNTLNGQNFPENVVMMIRDMLEKMYSEERKLKMEENEK